MFDRPELTGALFDKVTDYFVEVTRTAFEEYGITIDIFSTGNDLGGQAGPHALQPDLGGMDPAELKADFGDDILLNGAIDSRHILSSGENPDFVRRETLKILKIMAPGGDYMTGASHDTILPETPLENVLAMIDTVAGFASA